MKTKDLLLQDKLLGAQLAKQYAKELGLNQAQFVDMDNLNTQSSLPVVSGREVFDTGEPVVNEFIDPQAGQSLLRKPMYEELIRQLRVDKLKQGK